MSLLASPISYKFQGGGFNPLNDPDLVALYLALDATDDGATLTVPDRTANGYDLSVTDAGRAVLDATGFAGLQAVDFSAVAATASVLRSSAIGAGLNGQQSVTLLALMGNDPNPQTAAYTLRYGDGTVAGDWDLRSKIPSQGQQSIRTFQIGVGCDLQTVLRSELLLYPKVVVSEIDLSLAGSQPVGYWQNGKPVAFTYATNNLTPEVPGNRTLYVGSNSNGATSFKGRWAGLAVVKRLLTDAEIATWTTWLRTQYGMGTPMQVLWAGDSITAAADGYRLYIEQAYEAVRGVSRPWGTYETVGPLGLGATFPENWHYGVGGATIANVETNMATALAAGSAFVPDVVAFLCGVNDIVNFAASPAAVAAAWTSLLVSTYDLRPDVSMKLISLINNTTTPGHEANVIAANLLGPQAVADAIAARPAMDAQWVDGPYAVALADGTHPTTGPGGGYDVMGSALWPIVATWS